MTANGYTGAPAAAVDIDDVTGLQAALDAKLDETAPVVTDSTFTVVRSGGGAARWRSTGGALDIDTVGDIIESSFANQDFSGAQTSLRRLRAGSGNTLVGLTEFGSTAYTAGQSIDATTGVAHLGAKNSAVNIGISGFVDVDGPPVSGTWALNDLVITRTGAFRCSVAGTPGTWVGNSSGLSLAELPASPTPVADQIQMYALDLQTNSVPRMMLPEGIEIDPIRDTVFVVRNASGSSIAKGTVVYATGIHPGAGIIPTVAPAQANALAMVGVVGVMVEMVANAAYGRLMVQGRIDNLNTAALTSGAPIYLSPSVAGAMTTTAPSHPDYKVPVGVVLRSNASDGAVAVNLSALQGDLAGTAQNTFAIGSNTSGTKVIQFKNGFTGALQATPTAARTWTLPDATGTLAVNELSPIYAPSDHGLTGWAFDPSSGAFGATALTTSGLVRVARIRVLGSTLTNIHFHLTVGGGTLTSGQCFAAVYTDAGALLGAGAVTASLHGTGSNGWGDGGFKTHPLSVAQAVTPGTFYRIAWWYNGTTGPTMTRGSANGSAIINANLSASTARYATANTTITTTAPANLTGLAGDTTAWWVATS